jgi:hypothetical protein
MKENKMLQVLLIDKEMVNYHFSRKELLDIANLHDDWAFGPRRAYAYYIGRDPDDTAGIKTEDVEDFIIQFYTQFNAEFGLTY